MSLKRSTVLAFFSVFLLTGLATSLPAIVNAAPDPRTPASITSPALIVPIPIAGGGEQKEIPSNPGEYIKIIYQWSIGLAALIAMAQLVLGGVQYVISAGMPSAKNSAEERMTGAITGLVILLSIVIILTTINPKLLDIDLPTPRSVLLEGNFGPSSLGPQIEDVATPERNQQANAAKNRLAGKYLDAYNAMKAEIDELLDGRDDDDLQEIVGAAEIAGAIVNDIDDDDMPLARLTQLVRDGKIEITTDSDGDDFYEYAEKALDAWRGGDQVVGDGYRDAVVAAFNYALNKLDKPNNEHDDVARMLLLIEVIKPPAIKNIILNSTP